MNRFLAVSALVFLTLFASCRNDDDNNVAPPRDYGVQYLTDIDSIEEYLQTHYIADVDAEYNISIQPVTDPDTQTSIWDQTEYPLQSKVVNSINEDNTVEYTIYYLTLREGVGDSPTRADNVLVSYSGTLLDGTRFDYLPYPQSTASLYGTIEGWQEIIPMFKSGIYTDTPDNPDPATFEGYGAGVMFVPSGLAYFNSSPSSLVPSYSPLIFSFKLYAVQYTDLDEDGILNKDETEPGVDVQYYDTDGDGTPNFLDTDDDGDGYTTYREITIPDTTNQYPFDEIPTCSGGTLKKHLDPNCH